MSCMTWSACVAFMCFLFTLLNLNITQWNESSKMFLWRTQLKWCYELHNAMKKLDQQKQVYVCAYPAAVDRALWRDRWCHASVTRTPQVHVDIVLVMWSEAAFVAEMPDWRGGFHMKSKWSSDLEIGLSYLHISVLAKLAQRILSWSPVMPVLIKDAKRLICWLDGVL